MLSDTERTFLRLFIDCCKTGKFKELDKQYDKRYQSVLWHRINSKKDKLSNDYVILTKALEQKAILDGL